MSDRELALRAGSRSEDMDRMKKALLQLAKMIELRLHASEDSDSSPALPMAMSGNLLDGLEYTDPLYHRYRIVQEINLRLDEAIGPLLEEKLRGLPEDSDGHDSLPGIIEDLAQTKEFKQAVAALKVDMKIATEAVVEEIRQDEAELMATSSPRASKSLSSSFSVSSSRHSEGSSDADGAISLEDLLDDVSDAYEPERTLEQSLRDLIEGPTVEDRYDALKDIMSYEPSLLFVDSAWPQVLPTIVKGMDIDDPDIQEGCLKLFSDMFSSATSCDMCVIYEALANRIEASLKNLSPDRFEYFVKQLHLLNQFQQKICTCWIRSPRKILEPPGSMMVLHLLALIDLEADWFRKWMHAHRSRTMLLKVFGSSNMVALCVSICGMWHNIFVHPEMDLGQMFQCSSTMKKTLEDLNGYHPAHVQYACFLHCLRMLSHILLYNEGRALFPVHFKGVQGEATLPIEDWLMLLIKMMYAVPSAKILPKFASQIVDLIGTFLIKLAGEREGGRVLLCIPKVQAALVLPVADYSKREESNKCFDKALLYAADVLALLASRQTGRKVILQKMHMPSDVENPDKPTSVAHLFASVASTALKSYLQDSAGPRTRSSVPMEIFGAFLFVCRQLYNTCEGLSDLEGFGLHKLVAALYRKTREEARPDGIPLYKIIPQDEEDPEDDDRRPWAHVLLDNLLNFAGTPRGIKMLHQTGIFDDCVAYMVERFKNKMQVSKCEKFGYGVMALQLAATAPGMVALKKTGYVFHLVQNLWNVVCGGEDDERLTLPYHDPLDPMDRSTHKVMSQLIAIVTSFPGLAELLQSHEHRETPGGVETSSQEDIEQEWGWEPYDIAPELEHGDATKTIEGLFGVVLAKMNNEPISSVFNFHHAEHCILRLISITVTCLDSLILLEQRFDLRKMLLQYQEWNLLDDNRGFMINPTAIERNHILVATATVGGPSERVVPPREIENWKVPLDQSDDFKPATYKWPLFSEDPMPTVYVVEPANTSPDEENLAQPDMATELLTDALLTRSAYIEAVSGGQRFSRAMLSNFLRSAAASHPVTGSLLEVDSPREMSEPSVSSSWQASCKVGMDLVIKYGMHLGILKDNPKCRKDLEIVMKASFSLLQQLNGVRSREPSHKFLGFDWFVASMFLIFNGNSELCWSFLTSFAQLAASELVWPQRVKNKNPAAFISPMFFVTGHCIEKILQELFPLLCSAFQLSGCTPAQICQHWLWQCFWNYLDWHDIQLFLSTCIVMGNDYQTYFCIAIFKHLHDKIIAHSHKQSLLSWLCESFIEGFTFTPGVLTYMQELETKYRDELPMALEK